MSAGLVPSASPRGLPTPGPLARAGLLVGRNVTAYRHGWYMLLTGFLEPVFYLFSLGVGLGALVATSTRAAGCRCRTRCSSRPRCSPRPR